MLCNKLKLNDEKTEIIFCNPRNADTSLANFQIGNEKIDISDSAKNLGVYLDSKLSMNIHISHVCQQVYYEISKLKQMSKYLNESSLKTISSSFILSRFDYCNSLLINLPAFQIERLQKLQNYAARIILKKRRRDPATPLLAHLHWLPIQSRIDYKVAVLTYKCLNSMAPKYLSDLIVLYTPSRHLRSSEQHLLCCTKMNYKTLGERSFSFYSPKLWNSLPLYIRQAENISCFKTLLKTYLYRQNF